jgi:hypothetical protein
MAVEIEGHPEVPLLDEHGELMQMLTCCAECGQLRTILFLSKDRWFCFHCKTAGATPPNLYPIA